MNVQCSCIFLPLFALVLVHFIVVRYILDLFVWPVQRAPVYAGELRAVDHLIENELETIGFEDVLVQVVGFLDYVGWRWENWVETDSQGVLDHSRDDTSEKRTGELETRVCVYLD